MYIPLEHVAQSYAANAGGTAAKVVECEECKRRYVYQVRRWGRGEGASYFHLDKAGAQNRAAQRAERDLKQELRKAVDVVPCPGCGWVQSEMIPLARRQYLRRVRIVGVVLLATLFVPLLFLIGVVTRPGNDPFPTGLFVETMLFTLTQLVAGVGLLLGRSMALDCYDPNAEDVEQRLKRGRERATLLDVELKAPLQEPA